MPKRLTFRLIIISALFSLSVLVALPKVPIFVDSSLLRMDSQFGGYEIKIQQGGGEKVIDLNQYKKSSDAGESQMLTFELVDEGLGNTQQALESVIEVSKKRLDQAGVDGYIFNIEEDGKISVIIPSHIPPERVTNLIIGNGRVSFKKVKNADEWGQDQFANFYSNIDLWEDTGITESDMRGFVYSIAPTTGQAVLQLSFTPEGRQKFYSLAGENIGLPIGVFVNGYEFPLIMPVISENILEDTTADPSVTGNFDQTSINDLNLQIRNPLPYDVVSSESFVVEPILGGDFFYSYSTSFAIGLIAIFIFFIYKFNLLGVVFDVGLFMSVGLFLAFIKLFSIPISASLVTGVVLITGMISYIGYNLFLDMKKELCEGKPFDFVMQKVFYKEKEQYSILSIFVFIFSLAASLIVKGDVGALFRVISTGMISVIYFYSFAFPVLVQAFGGHKK